LGAIGVGESSESSIENHPGGGVGGLGHRSVDLLSIALQPKIQVNLCHKDISDRSLS
jgi:hypothetical protein